MRFPESPREGTEAHGSALRRMETARDERNRSREAYDSAQDEPDKRAAADDLAEANEQLAAREAWVSWVERGY